MLPNSNSRLRVNSSFGAESELPSGWSVQAVQVAGQTFHIRGPCDPDELLDCIDEQSEESPYWGALWPSATMLATEVLRGRWRTGTRTIELGCGLGLVGIAAMAVGHAVTLTDSVPDAVRAAAANAERNGLKAADIAILDWKHPFHASFEFALGSDLLYDRDLFQPLLDTLDRVLVPGAECWLSDPGRSTVAGFVQMAQAGGYEVRIDHPESLPEAAQGAHFQRLRLARKALADLQ